MTTVPASALTVRPWRASSESGALTQAMST